MSPPEGLLRLKCSPRIQAATCSFIIPGPQSNYIGTPFSPKYGLTPFLHLCLYTAGRKRPGAQALTGFTSRLQQDSSGNLCRGRLCAVQDVTRPLYIVPVYNPLDGTSCRDWLDSQHCTTYTATITDFGGPGGTDHRFWGARNSADAPRRSQISGPPTAPITDFGGKDGTDHRFCGARKSADAPRRSQILGAPTPLENQMGKKWNMKWKQGF